MIKKIHSKLPQSPKLIFLSLTEQQQSHTAIQGLQSIQKSLASGLLGVFEYSKDSIGQFG